MVARIITGTISGGYTIASQYSELSITTTGVISGGYVGVVSTHNATIVNNGSIVNSGAESIDLRAGGKVSNGSMKNSAALINQGVYILNGPGSVSNFGTITATTNSNTGQYIFGVYFNGGGTITNGAKAHYGAYIGGAGINMTNASGVVKNFGRIEANNSGGVGISLYAGSVNNGSATDRSALISGAAIGLATSHAATVNNFGTIESGGLGVRLAGGKVTSGSASDTQALIVGAYGVNVTGGATLRNFGAIQGTSGGAVYIDQIGAGASVSLVNGVSNDKTALIVGATYGVFANASAATVTNYGTIEGMGGTAVRFNSASDMLIVEGGSSLIGVARGGGGTLQLATGRGTITGLGTNFTGFATYMVQTGGIWTLSGTSSLGAGTTLTNRGTMTVRGTLSERGSLTNVGSISGAAGGIALQLAGGVLTNSGVVIGGASGAGAVGGTAVQLAGGYVANSSAIEGGAGGGSQGGAGGSGGTAVQMLSGVFTNRGTVTGGGGGSAGTAHIAGAGGVGAYLASGSVFTNTTLDLIEGGEGGAGGGGGVGGVAADVAGGYLSNSGVIIGGTGGLGSNTGPGAGGAGATVSQSGKLINKGQINGGAGGGGGTAGLGVMISGSGTVDNFGTISGGVYSVALAGGGGLLMVETGSVLYGAVQGGGGTLELASGSGTITNLGATGTISGSEAVTFSGFGSYRTDAGTTWTLNGAETVGSHATLSDNGRVSSAGALTLSGTISGSGSLTVTGGTATIAAGAAVTVATLELQAGTTTLNESLTYSGAFTEDANSTLTLGSNDQLVISNAVRLSGLINGDGTMSVGNASIAAFSVIGSDVLIATGSITQSGAVANGGGSATEAGILIAKGATWTILGGTVILRSAPNSFLEVDGKFVGACATGPSRISNAIVDSGLIEAASGTLTLAGEVTGSGALSIDNGATLTVNSSVASSLTATFMGASGTLVLRQSASSFAATIAGFGVGDVIDLLNIAATGASVNANDQLVIVNGNKNVATLQLSGNYNGDTFSTVSDGNGGTDVVLSTAQSPSAHAFVATMAGLGAQAGHAIVSFASPSGGFRPTLLARPA